MRAIRGSIRKRDERKYQCIKSGQQDDSAARFYFPVYSSVRMTFLKAGMTCAATTAFKASSGTKGKKPMLKAVSQS